MGEINTINTCPKCHSNQINYGQYSFEGETITYNATCENCNNKFIEVYHVEYIYSKNI